jgi:enterochelin esterase-like enzyme
MIFMKKITMLLLLCVGTMLAQSFPDFLQKLAQTEPGRREAVVDSFMGQLKQTPITEGTQAHFLYRGSAGRVNLAGDMNNWDANALSLNQVAGSSFWYLTMTLENDARLDYKFVSNGTTWILDPRNPYTCAGGFGANSELRMPGYAPPPEVAVDPMVSHGTLFDTTITSAIMGYGRRMQVYMPVGYDTEKRFYPLLLVHDGTDYINLAGMTTVLDNLIAQKKIQPLIAVFVPAVRREDEYAGYLQESFGRYITREVLPFIDRRFRTLTDPRYRGTMGASNGGNISIYLGYSFPEQFGNVIAQSSYIQPGLQQAFQTQPQKALRFYLDIGTYDIPLLIPMVRSFSVTLKNKGYGLSYQEVHEGHSWGNWKAHIDDALLYMFPAQATGVEWAPARAVESVRLTNYPNPFNDSTTIRIYLPHDDHVVLRVENLIGQEVAQLHNGFLRSGAYAFHLSASALPSGLYICHVETPQQVFTLKLNCIR